MGRDFNEQAKEYQYDILDSIYEELYDDDKNLNRHVGELRDQNKSLELNKDAIDYHEYNIKEADTESEIEAEEENIKRLDKQIKDIESNQEKEKTMIDTFMNKKISFNDFNKHIRKVALGKNIFDAIEDEDFSLEKATNRANAIRQGFISLIVGSGISEEIEGKMPSYIYNNLLKEGQQTIIRSNGTGAYSKFSQFGGYKKNEVARELGLRMSADALSSIMEEKEKKLFGEAVNTPYNTKGKDADEIVSDDKKVYEKVTKVNITEYAKSLRDMKKIIDAKPWYRRIFSSIHNKQKDAFENAKKALVSKGVDLKALNSYLDSSDKKADKKLDDMFIKSADGINRFGFENSKKKGLIPENMTFEIAKELQLEAQRQKEKVVEKKTEIKKEEYNFGFDGKDFKEKEQDGFVIVVDEAAEEVQKVDEATNDNVNKEESIVDINEYDNVEEETLEDLENQLQ